jgi:hypothetical protein
VRAHGNVVPWNHVRRPVWQASEAIILCGREGVWYDWQKRTKEDVVIVGSVACRLP